MKSDQRGWMKFEIKNGWMSNVMNECQDSAQNTDASYLEEHERAGVHPCDEARGPGVHRTN